MEIYDQHEQGERVRSWLKDNGTAIISGIAIGLAAIFGYHQWQVYRLQQAQIAATLYDQSRQSADGTDAVAKTARDRLRSEFPGSGYAVLAAIEQAKEQFAAGDVESARVSLAWAREKTDVLAMKVVVAIRQARLELAQGRPDAALALLSEGVEGRLGAEQQELRGDILVALGRIDEAKEAYLKAQLAGVTDPMRLAMKLAEHAAAGDEA